jgi:hypothetical protein
MLQCRTTIDVDKRNESSLASDLSTRNQVSLRHEILKHLPFCDEAVEELWELARVYGAEVESHEEKHASHDTVVWLPVVSTCGAMR